MPLAEATALAPRSAGPGATGRVEGAGTGEGPERGRRCRCRSRERRWRVPRGVRRDRRTDGPTREGRGPAARSVSGDRARGAGRAAARGAGARGEGGGRGGGGPGCGSARGVGLRPLPWQRKRSPGLPSPSFSFLSNQRKINTRRGKTIAGPPGTRRAHSSHVGARAGGGTGSGGPTSEPLPDLPPRRVGLPAAPGLGGRRKEFPGVKHLVKVLQEQSGFPQLLGSVRGY